MHINYEYDFLPEDSLNYAVYINDLKEKEDGIIKEFYKLHGWKMCGLSEDYFEKSLYWLLSNLVFIFFCIKRRFDFLIKIYYKGLLCSKKNNTTLKKVSVLS